MPTSVLEQYRVADLIQWHEDKQLLLNPSFQRRAVWNPPAKVFLIDTILRKLPVPKIYMRTRVDLVSKKSYREIVDGQQRLRAIIDFSQDKFALTTRAKEFAGLRYSEMSSDLKEVFLSYPLAVDQLINASDAEVLEIFSRLNVYNVRLNAAELRHAEFQGALKWAIHETSRRASGIWESLETVSLKQRLRMADDSLVAEMFSIVLKGITDGGQSRIDKFYKDHDDKADENVMKEVGEKVLSNLQFIADEFGDILRGSVVGSSPHLLMLFAAVTHAKSGIPQGELQDPLPIRDKALTDLDIARTNIEVLNGVISGDISSSMWNRFAAASSSSTQRIASRNVRFPVYFSALLPVTLE